MCFPIDRAIHTTIFHILDMGQWLEVKTMNKNGPTLVPHPPDTNTLLLFIF